ncbi:MAG: cytochrome d ubiquinol oxidase subunit II [Gammaproteobacteria bacterium]
MTGDAYWLPIVFLGLMGLAFLVYAVLDGYDLGVGILLPRDSEAQRDAMIASIGPFWDANETWLVLAIGILLIAFPSAHAVVLGELYLPVALMLAGLILRGVAFDFRAKARLDHKTRWDYAFKAGSLLAAATQGYMLGLYVMGFAHGPAAQAFALLSAVCVTAGYAFIGAAWLVMKTEDALQARAVRAARRALRYTALGIVAVSLVNPLVVPGVAAKWLGFPAFVVLAPVPLVTAALFLWADRHLARYPWPADRGCWMPFAAAVGVFVLCFGGLAYSFYPWVVPGRIDIWAAASAPASLRFILVGTVIVLPAIIGYTVFAYRVFRGKSSALS